MTKADVVTVMSKEAKVSKAAAEKALDAFAGAVTGALRKGDKLTLAGFMTLSVGKRKARKGRNPQTGEEIRIPAVRIVKFKAGNVLKGAIN